MRIISAASVISGCLVILARSARFPWRETNQGRESAVSALVALELDTCCFGCQCHEIVSVHNAIFVIVKVRLCTPANEAIVGGRVAGGGTVLQG